MIARILKFFGYKVIYLANNREYTRRYDSIDLMMCRPIHYEMTVAPPNAKIKIVKIKN